MDYSENTTVAVPKWLYLMVFIAGALTVFSFAPFNIYPLAWFGPALLFYALLKANTKSEYFKLSWLYGLGLFGLGTSWPFYSLYFFAKAHILVAVLGTLLFVVFISLFSTALFGLLASLFRNHSRLLRLMVFFPAAWVLVEWFRTWFLTGFPWLFLGNSQIDNWLSAVAPVTGVLGVSFICALLAGLSVSFCLGKAASYYEGFEIDFTSQKSSSLKIRISSVVIALIIVGLSFLLSRVDWTEKTGDSIKVSVLQANVAQEVKLQSSSLLPTIDTYKEMTNQSSDSDLIVWPETALYDSFNRHMDSLIVPLQESLKGTNKAILLGGFYLNENQGIENSVLALADGQREVYSKRHLVPFGEYTPLLSYLRWMDKWIQLPYDNIAKGVNNGVLKINDYAAQMTVCYEDAFGAEMISAIPETQLLINVTHDGWFTGSFEPYQHMQIARMRSLEMGRYMVRSTTNGPAGIIDEKGKIVATAPIYTKSIITGDVELMQGSTPYVSWGDWLITLLMSLIMLLGFIFKWKN